MATVLTRILRVFTILAILLSQAGITPAAAAENTFVVNSRAADATPGDSLSATISGKFSLRTDGRRA